jgi:hypothetical protein
LKFSDIIKLLVILKEGKNMINQFKNMEIEYIKWLETNLEGYVYNDYGGLQPRNNKLHKAYCRTLQIPICTINKTSYRKICSPDLQGLVQWLNKNKGLENEVWSRCQFCNPV